MPESESSPRQTLAVLLGASSFRRAPKLAQGRAFYNSAQDFHEYLLAPGGLGLPRENVISLFDDTRSPGDQLQDIGDFIESRSAYLNNNGTPPQDLIAYYVGHGLFSGPDQAYCLAIRATDERSEGLTSIRVSDLASIIKAHARFLRKYLILDCCFSAAAYREFQSGPLQAGCVKLLDELPQRGTTLLCSASAQDPSLAPEGLPRTMFSDSLLRALRQGHPSLGPQLSLSELGDLVKVTLREAYPDIWVRPEVHSPDQREGDVASVRLFPNKAYVAQKAEEARQKAEAERARQEAETQERTEAERKAQQQAVEARQKAEAERARQEADTRERAEAERRAQEQAEQAREIAEAEKVRQEAEAKEKGEAERKAQKEAKEVRRQAVAEPEARGGLRWSRGPKVYFGLFLSALILAIFYFALHEKGSSSDEPASLTTLMTLNDGSLWAGFRDGGLARLATDSTWQIYTKSSTNGGLPSDSVHALARSPDGSLWVGTGGGLARLDKHGHWETYTKSSTNGGLPSDFVGALARSPDGSLWVGTYDGYGGLARLDNDGHWHNYTKASTSGGLPDDHISRLASIPDGSLWVGTDGGLARLDKHGHWQTYTQISANGGYDIRGLASSPDGSLWAAIHGGGLIQLDKDGNWHNYTKASTNGGLPSDLVETLDVSPDSSIWVTTFLSTNLIQLDKDGKWHNYTEASTNGGLPSGYDYCVTASPDGSLWVAIAGSRLVRRDKDGHWQNYTIKVWPVRTS